jgi:hypothetical protein
MTRQARMLMVIAVLAAAAVIALAALANKYQRVISSRGRESRPAATAPASLP